MAALGEDVAVEFAEVRDVSCSGGGLNPGRGVHPLLPPCCRSSRRVGIAGVLGRPCKLDWSAQPAAPTHLRAEATWRGPVGVAAKLARALREWPMLRFEITEEPTAHSDGERLCHVPGRGFHRSMMSASGDLMIGEERLRGLLARARSGEEFAHGLHEILGSSWDAELEPYRAAGEGSPVTLVG